MRGDIPIENYSYYCGAMLWGCYIIVHVAFGCAKGSQYCAAMLCRCRILAHVNFCCAKGGCVPIGFNRITRNIVQRCCVDAIFLRMPIFAARRARNIVQRCRVDATLLRMSIFAARWAGVHSLDLTELRAILCHAVVPMP